MKAIAQQQRAPGIVEGLPKWLGASSVRTRTEVPQLLRLCTCVGW